LKKPDYSVCYFRTSGFDSFRIKPNKELNPKILKIQGVLRHEKGLKGIKEPRWKKSKPKAEAVKTGLSGLGNWTIWFFLKR
jgi:hypothetical protein